MFNDSKYTRWYYDLISRAQSRTPQTSVIYERHHIIPKSLGGANDSSNIVQLTIREHWVAHRLLARAVQDTTARSRMNYALHLLGRRLSAPNSRIFEVARQSLRAANSARTVLASTREKISKAARNRGRAGTAAATQAAALSNRGRQHTSQSRERMSAAQRGKTLSSSHRAAISRSRAGRSVSEQQRVAASARLRENNPRRCEWLLIDPNNQLVRTRDMLGFCNQLGLAYSALRARAQRGDSAPVTRGPSQGWSVFAVRALTKIVEPLSAEPAHLQQWSDQ